MPNQSTYHKGKPKSLEITGRSKKMSNGEPYVDLFPDLNTTVGRLDFRMESLFKYASLLEGLIRLLIAQLKWRARQNLGNLCTPFSSSQKFAVLLQKADQSNEF